MWSLFGVARHATLQSPLSLEICRERLRGETGSRWNPFSRWTHPVRGSVNENGFRIVRAIGYNNSMQTEAAGTWAADGNGTRIEVTLGLERTTRWGLALWFDLHGDLRRDLAGVVAHPRNARLACPARGAADRGGGGSGRHVVRPLARPRRRRLAGPFPLPYARMSTRFRAALMMPSRVTLHHHPVRSHAA